LFPGEAGYIPARRQSNLTPREAKWPGD
jgi:hypothetical protein